MQLLKHFKELTVNSKNAKELKGLILQLAIQGKLTANWRKENTNIEPASELLDRIQKEKEQLAKEKKIKKDKELPKLTDEEIPFNIAKSWIWTRLGEIGTTNVGLTYKPAHKNETGVPVLRSSNIQEGELCLNDLVRVNTEYREKDIIEKGDLLICARNGSRRLVGKCTIIGQIDEVMVFGAFMAIFRSNFNQYLQLFIQSPQYRSKLDGVETTTINQITQGNLKATSVPLPPLEEQKEIVKVVETLFKEVDKLEQLTVARISLKEDFVRSALKELTNNNTKKEWDYLQEHFKSFFNETTNIKKLRETVLQLAVQGKLTADWRANNPRTEDATILLKRIQKEKAQLIEDKKIKKEKILPKITKEEIPYKIPDGWVWCRMGTISDIIAGASFKSGDFNKTGGVKCIKITNAGVRIFVETNDYLPKGFDKLHLNYLIKEGDLILALTRPYIKDGLKISICPSTYNNSLLNQRVASIRSMTKEIYHPYIFSYIQSPKVLSFYKSKFDGKSQQPNMKMGDITDLLISVPPLEEQKAIVEKVNALMSLCDKLEQEVQQSEAHSKQLMKSCLKEVFVG
ncbi:restriction endonuclease subunit S [Tenacibaculum dicentrarchi]|uniref:restriction endonuclease subunit S n=1 Tax=Tenacibaculum dicentrarchi TaxID=669041 RepID=UPI003512030C